VVDELLDLLQDYGSVVVFSAAMIENVFIAGMFMPGEAIVLAAGLATRFSDLNPFVVMASAALGEIAGNGISIAIGHYAGPPLIDKWGGWLERRGVDVEDVRDYVEEKGAMALLLGRPAWGLKNVLPAMVGISDMPPWKAMVYVTIASAVYYPVLVGLGWLLGLGFETTARYVSWFGAAVGAAFVIAVVVVWRRMRRRQQTKTEGQ